AAGTASRSTTPQCGWCCCCEPGRWPPGTPACGTTCRGGCCSSSTSACSRSFPARACALSVEALPGHARPYDERGQALWPPPGQLDSAANLRALLAGSALMPSHRESRHAVQDAYCLRCAPQVHGALRDVLGFPRSALETELGSVVDNPVIAGDGEVMISGNFHGEPLAFAADMLAMALAE